MPGGRMAAGKLGWQLL